jgi:hypothetical protein
MKKFCRFWLTLIGAFSATYFLFVRKRLLTWGLTSESARMILPGDYLVPSPVQATTRGIIISAPPQAIWHWLVQIGQGRGGFYSYDWLENLLGLNIHNADRILPEFQDLHPGDLIPFWRNAGVRVIDIQPQVHLVLAGTLFGGENRGEALPNGGSWVFVLQPIGSTTTRLVVRSAVAWFEPRWLCQLFSWLLLEPTYFVMEMGMLNGIKRRVERLERSTNGLKGRLGKKPSPIQCPTVCA